MAENKGQKESFNEQKNRKETSIEDEREYQKSLEGTDKKVTLKQKFKVLSSSFKIYFLLYLTTIVWIPLILTLIIVIGESLTASMPDFNLSILYTIVEYYTKIVNFGWVTDIITSNYYNTNIIELISKTTGITIVPILLMIYIIIQAVITFTILLSITPFFIKNKSVKTDGEIELKRLNKIFKTAGQTQLSEKELSDNQGGVKKVMEFAKKLKKIVKEDNGHGYEYFYLNAIDVYRFFFERFDSRMANTIAGEYNKRWEEMSKYKREIHNDKKFFNLIDSGYISMGKGTEDEKTKTDILKNMPYMFIGVDKSGKKYFFNDKTKIFNEKNKTILKRNVFILLGVTNVLKNYPIAPLYKYLREKYGIEYNKEEQLIISKFRKIYEIYERTDGEDFITEKMYSLPLQLQYLRISDEKDRHKKIKGIIDYTKIATKNVGFYAEMYSFWPEDPEEAKEEFLYPFFEAFIKFENNIVNMISRNVLEFIEQENSIKKDIIDYKKSQKIDGLIIKQTQQLVRSEYLAKYIQYKEEYDEEGLIKHCLVKDKDNKETKAKKIFLIDIDYKEWEITKIFDMSTLELLRKDLSGYTLDEHKRIANIVIKNVYKIHKVNPLMSPLEHYMKNQLIHTSLKEIKNKLKKK